MHSRQIQSHDRGRTTGQMPCPNCEAPIPVTFDSLLIRGELTCPHPECKTVLKLNRGQSHKAISAVRELRTRLDEHGLQTG